MGRGMGTSGRKYFGAPRADIWLHQLQIGLGLVAALTRSWDMSWEQGDM